MGKTTEEEGPVSMSRCMYTVLMIGMSGWYIVALQYWKVMDCIGAVECYACDSGGDDGISRRNHERDWHGHV